ncbi:MAG: sigma-70 family RNA polymerase sigma factor [Rhodospirillaceae bacterium]|nr:sigma-70 family RNA polymerase sigma factor [Rhodospirillaceae bacterium]
MAADTRKKAVGLALVWSDSAEWTDTPSQEGVGREIDWSILMARAQAGDSACYRRLLLEASPYLRSLARRRGFDQTECEDAVQDILLTVHAIRQTYDPTRPFGPWLVAIASRRLIDRLRQRGRRFNRETELTTEHETYVDQKTNIETDMERRQILEDAIRQLSPGEQQAIKMLKIREMSLNEAAVASGMTVGALKVATHRALKKLRDLLSDRKEKS